MMFDTSQGVEQIHQHPFVGITLANRDDGRLSSCSVPGFVGSRRGDKEALPFQVVKNGAEQGDIKSC